MTTARYKLKTGEGLMKYCKLHNIPYTPIWERVAVKNMTPEQALEDYQSHQKKPPFCTYYYKGIPFRKYCKEHNLKYQQILDYRRFWDIPLELAIKKFHKDQL